MKFNNEIRGYCKHLATLLLVLIAFGCINPPENSIYGLAPDFATELLRRQRELTLLPGPYLKKKRQAASISQARMGKVLGYHPQYISNWERGESAPPPSALRSIADLLKIPEKEFLKVLMAESRDYWVKRLSLSADI